MSKQLRNPEIAARLVEAINSTTPGHYETAIIGVLDEMLPSRKASAASSTVGGFRAGDPNTSVEAALKVNVTRQEMKILAYLLLYDTSHWVFPEVGTADKIAAGTGLLLSSVSTRMKGLVTSGRVNEVGDVMVNNSRKTSYKITESGRMTVREFAANHQSGPIPTPEMKPPPPPDPALSW